MEEVIHKLALSQSRQRREMARVAAAGAAAAVAALEEHARIVHTGEFHHETATCAVIMFKRNCRTALSQYHNE
eukprot:9669424-Prorocentrum_lima.AAC.1